MSFINIQKLKKIYPASKLKKTLDNLILQIELIKGDYNLDKTFTIIGDELLKINISSVISVIDNKRKNIIIRYFRLRDKFQTDFGEIDIKEIEINQLSGYQEALHTRQTALHKNRIAQLKHGLPQIKLFLDKIEERNSIISPLILRGEIIGFIEYFSKYFDLSDIKVIENFSQELVLRIANTILFQEIKRSEERFRELWENAPVAYHILDTSGFIKNVNQTEVKMLGYSKYEMIGKSIFQFILPEQRDEARRRYKLKLTGQKVSKKTDRIYLKKDGSRIYVSIDDILEYDSNGKLIGVRTTMVDITKSKQAEVALQQNYDFQNAIDSLLRLSLKDTSLEKLLEQALKELLAITWLAFEKKGSIFLVEDNPNVLVMKAQSGLSNELQEKCAHISIGECICGQAALKKKIQFVDSIGHDHKISYKGITPHGHYCTPILFADNLLGVINIYIKAGHIRSRGEEEFLTAYANALAGVIQRKKIKEAYKKSEKKFKQFFETNAEYCYIISPQGKIIDINKTALKMLGYSKEELIGKPIISTIYAPSSQVKAKKLFIKWQKEGKLRDEELNIITKQGGERTVLLDVNTIKDARGKIIHSTSVQRDITEKKLAEEEIRRLSEFNQRIIDHAPVSIVVLNKEGVMIAVNDLAQKLMNKTEQQLIGRKISDIKGVQRSKELINRYKLLLGQGESFYYQNLPYLPEDSKEEKYLNIIAVPLYDNNSNVDGAISMALDNTEAVLAKRELEALNKELEEKVLRRTRQLDIINQELNRVLELKSKFIADASHELRTPLTIMQGNLDLAIRECKSSHREIPEAFTLVNKEVEQIAHILTDLTMLTNVDSQTEMITYEKVNIEMLIEAVMQSLKVLADQKQVTIQHPNNNNNLIVMGDDAKLEKMLLNILRNAIKYNKLGGWIKIWAESDESEIRVAVQDSGIGIPEKDLPYIFERFYRVDAARTRSEGGTGLGMAISKWIAEAHGGKIKAESELDIGSIFTVHLPYDYKNKR